MTTDCKGLKKMVGPTRNWTNSPVERASSDNYKEIEKQISTLTILLRKNNNFSKVPTLGIPLTQEFGSECRKSIAL